MENLGNDFSTTLAAAIVSTGATTIQVASSTGAPAPNFRIRVDDEWMLVTAIAHPTWTVERGIEGSTAATHLNGSTVAHVVTVTGLDNFGFESHAAFFPGADTGAVRVVGTERQWNVYEELLVRGELVVDGGNINLMGLT